MRDLTTTEMELCAGGAPAQNGFAKPENRSITAYDPQGDRDNQKPSRGPGTNYPTRWPEPT
jgi:hypothetical protein